MQKCYSIKMLDYTDSKYFCFWHRQTPTYVDSPGRIDTPTTLFLQSRWTVKTSLKPESARLHAWVAVLTSPSSELIRRRYIESVEQRSRRWLNNMLPSTSSESIVAATAEPALGNDFLSNDA